MCQLLPSGTMNDTYIRTCYGMQETNPHYTLCSQCLYTHRSLYPSLFMDHAVLCTGALLVSQKVFDMPIIHLHSCLDRDVMMVTVKHNDRMFIISWITFEGVTKTDRYSDQVVSMSVQILVTEYVMCFFLHSITCS